ncbi:MAG: alpha-glucan family phosphorylase [Verrucomicrobia bacterium]|nr:alpha-glucan family phosphorylase [Verrucomicrobiota bacterium]
MKPARKFVVVPSLPDKLRQLWDLAYNLWWCWNPEAIDLFRRMDRDLWEQVYHNPVAMLGVISSEQLEHLAADDGFLAHMERTYVQFADYMSGATWFKSAHPDAGGVRIAYFSLEFGLSESVPIYSGGLGILAGDHTKSASDLGVPLVGVGLLYREGYFRQYLNADGWQQEYYPDNDFFNMPVSLVRGSNGKPVVIDVDFPNGKVYVQVWQALVGRVTLYLLDANIDENRPEDREITARLYGGDTGSEDRIRQEITLGIGGIRALSALGIEPQVCHMNEGHAAFLALERTRLLMEQKKASFAEAREAVAAGNVFTTHTPVPAGNDMFPPQLMDKFFSKYWPTLGLSRHDFLALGRQNPNDKDEPFCMTVLALKFANYANGVSKLHGEVSRRMWTRVWEGVPVEEVPITSITNGIHTRSWISHELVGLYDRYLGPKWIESPTDQSVWERVEQIPDGELWRTHERRRERLVAFARRRLADQLKRRGAPPGEIAQAEEALDPEALTIGFARRFASYKRATLLLRDPERLERLLAVKERPLQIIFAGKAHPKDNGGKELIRQIVQFARRHPRQIVFLEDYDINVARYLVQGVDVWLNTPRRPMEASGTSGMKVTANGSVNMSIPDGWWVEGYNNENGWTIGLGEDYGGDYNYQDDVESRAIYNMLEKEVVPMFYDRGADDLPRRWIDRMKSAMRTICSVFNTNRMVHEYVERSYVPAAKRYERLRDKDLAKARALAGYVEAARSEWPKLRIETVETDSVEELPVGSDLKVRARVRLGALAPDDVAVQIYEGLLDQDGNITDAEIVPMMPDKDGGDGVREFVGSIVCRTSGQHGFSVRIIPKHEDLASPFSTGLIVWK